MARLTQRRFQMVLDCIGQIYAHHDLDGFAPLVLKLGMQATGADWAGYDEINVRQRRHNWISEPCDLDLSGPDEAHAHFFAEHPFVQHLARTGEVPVVRISDFLTRRQYRETGLYREAYRKFGVEYQTGFTLPSPTPQCSVGLCFNRSRKDFSEEDKLMLELLRPHLFQAYRNAELVTRLRQTATTTMRALDAAPQAVVVLDASGHVRVCSSRARGFFTNYFGRTPRSNGRLPETLQRWLQRHRLPATTANEFPVEHSPFVVEQNGRQLTVRTLAIADGGRMLVLEERQTALSIKPLQRLGLTERQAEVLMWVAQGKTNPEIGKILGVSEGTVHKHTEHIYAKLGVETRTAAAQRAFETLNGDGGQR